MTPIKDIPNNPDIHKIKKYRYKLDIINDNIPLNLLKRRLHAQKMIELYKQNIKKENKQMNRKFCIIDSQLKKHNSKVMFKDNS